MPVFGHVAEALDGVDVLVDYTSHDAVRGNTLVAIERSVSVIIGASGLRQRVTHALGAAYAADGAGPGM
ncbi:hypothetical protein GCM10022226_11680 [Sphaerisporangium flaviroseum]|uniref:Dihydrodipicolinate reductase N-terminal domain-containing protein n=1 Tax=Sphaerisporangium flaviroseum TaxID=509199 RepID=A0ABP7HKH4_9ACTN